MKAQLSVIAMTFAILAASNVGAAIKCWENNEGIRECGNAVPPEYAQQGHQKINKRGIVIGEKKRAKTDEELAEEERIANEKAAEAERLAQERAKDRVLLDTFSSVDDLELARDGRIAAIQSQIRITESQNEKLDKNLNEIIENAADLEKQGKTPTQKHRDDIASVRSQIERNNQFIAAKEVEKETVREKFAADIARFRKLKGGDF